MVSLSSRYVTEFILNLGPGRLHVLQCLRVVDRPMTTTERQNYYELPRFEFQRNRKYHTKLHAARTSGYHCVRIN
jgi:hypothetical protein